jgi:hypothetical protein
MPTSKPMPIHASLRKYRIDIVVEGETRIMYDNELPDLEQRARRMTWQGARVLGVFRREGGKWRRL